MPGYRAMICAHGVLATIAFLGLVPLSVLIIRYYSRWNPYWAFKLHVWCQVLTLFISTIVFVLGWFAVGPERSLSNPHHGIGLAIYVLVIFQVMWGYLVHRIERNKKRFHVPFKLVVSASLSISCACFTFADAALDPSLDWSYPGHPGYCPDTIGSHFIWFAKGVFHLVRNCGFHSARGILSAVLSIRYRRLPYGERVR